MSVIVVQLCGKHFACFLDEGHLGPCSVEARDAVVEVHQPAIADVRASVPCFNCGHTTELVLFCRRCGKLHAAP